MTPNEIYWLTLLCIISGCLVAGYLLGDHYGHRRGLVEGYDACLEEFFDENGDLRTDDDDDDDTVLDIAILEDIYADN